jgi:2-iminobutanoate/2-iminopropanoate deaminase
MSEENKREVISKADQLPFSKTLAYGDLVFVSGMIGRNPKTGEIAKSDVAEQTRQVLENIQEQLQLAGTSLDRALKLTIFLTDMSYFGAMNQVYRGFFKEDLPTRSCVAVSALPDKDALVEIEVISAR